MNRIGLVIAVCLVLASLPGAQAQTTAADAAEYIFPYFVEDPADDQSFVGGPSGSTPENDIRSLEITDDGQTMVTKITMGTLDFAAPAGTVTLAFQTTGPGGEDWETTIIYEDGGTAMSFADFDPSSGDPDVAYPSPRGEAVASENAIYLFYDFSAGGLQDGGVFTIDSLSSGRGTAVGAFTNVDVVDVGGTTYTLQNGAFSLPPSSPDFSVHHEDLAGGSDGRDLLDLNGTHDVYRYNFTNEAANVTFGFGATVLNGSVAVALVDAADNTLLANTYVDDSNDTLALTNQTAGAWTLEINFTGFSGDVSFSLSPTPAEGTATDDGDDGDDGSDGGDGTDGGGDDAGGNATGAEGEDSPALAASLLLIGLLVMAVRRRR